MKIIISILILNVSLGWSAQYDCQGDAGNQLKISTNNLKQIKAIWYGYQSIFHKIPTQLAVFTGEHYGKIGETFFNYNIQDIHSELQGVLKFYQTLKFIDKCHRGGCSKFPVTNNIAELSLKKKVPSVYKFICKKIN